jgi:hypothetical protein
MAYISPLQSAMQNAVKFSSDLQNLRAQETARPFLEPSLQEKLRQAQLATGLKQNELNYAPRMSAAELAFKQAQAPHLNASTQEILQTIADKKRQQQLAEENPLLGQTGPAGQIGALMFLQKLRDQQRANAPQQFEETESPNISSFADQLKKVYGSGDQAPQQIGIGEQQQNPLQDLFRQNLQQQPNIVSKTPIQAQPNQYDHLTDLLQKSIENKLNPSFGITGVGAGPKEQLFFEQTVKKDNPNLTDDQAYEAANVIANGGDSLSDGTKLNISQRALTSLDRLTKGTTTTAALNQAIRGTQAERELDVLNNYATKGLAPYGDTFADMNPKQIADTFKSDKASQERLGRFVAAQGLQYEIAQQRIKLANGEPGVTSTNELINLSKQTINAKYPRLSKQAREEAARYMDEALKAGFNARQSAGLGAFSYRGGNAPQETSSQGYDKIYNPKTGRIE